MSLAIRRYEPADLNEMARIWLEASRVGHPFLDAAVLQRQFELVRDIYLPQAETWVAYDGTAPVGFIGLLDNFIGGLFVDPVKHGTGAGRALVEHAAALKGPLNVDVYALNVAALGFYRRLGFIERSRLPTDAEGLPFELFRMARD